MSRFDYVKYDERAQSCQAKFKDICEDLEGSISLFLRDSRAKALAYTAWEECYMWIGKAIRDDQIQRNGSAELQEDRHDG